MDILIRVAVFLLVIVCFLAYATTPMDILIRVAVFLHIIAATVFAMTLIIMQYAVSPSVGKIPASPQKEAAMAQLQGRWHPVVDVAIITLDITGFLLLVTRWHLIGTTPILHVKATLGIIALTCASTLHFYFRGHKRKLKANGQTERLAKVNRITAIMERTALVTALITFLAGISFNHSPF